MHTLQCIELTFLFKQITYASLSTSGLVFVCERERERGWWWTSKEKKLMSIHTMGQAIYQGTYIPPLKMDPPLLDEFWNLFLLLLLYNVFKSDGTKKKKTKEL